MCKKRVSVVIPVQNRVLELRRAIDSVLRQKVQCSEVIVVENNSHVDNVRLLRAEVLSIDDDRVSFHSLLNCRNANVARNYGASVSKCELIAYLDSDDEWEDDHIENCLSIMEETSSDFVYGAAKVFDGENFFVKSSRQIGHDERPLDFLLGFKRGYAQTSSYVVKKELWEKVRWDESLARHQDYDFFSRVASSGSVACNPNPDYIIHWKKGDSRSFDFESTNNFYFSSRQKMSFKTEIRYLLLMAYSSFRSSRFKLFGYYLWRLPLVFFR